MNNNIYKDTQEIGKRLRLLRKAAKLTHSKLADLIGVSYVTICTWEKGKISGQIKQKSIQKLLNAFQEKGIYFSTQWLITGAGETPTINGKKIFDEESISKINEISQQKELLQQSVQKPAFQITQKLNFTEEIHAFTSLKNAVIHKIENSFLEPFYEKGDIVGGIWEKNFSFQEKKMCILTLNERIEIGLVQNSGKDSLYNVSLIQLSLNGIVTLNKYENYPLILAAPIIRLWR